MDCRTTTAACACSRSGPSTAAPPSPPPPTTSRYQYTNHLGTAALELDGTAAIISYEEFHPFGTTSYAAKDSTIDVSAKRYPYIGKERDDETGLYHLGARYYAAWLGRWTAADPIGLGDGPNRYRYARNNPIALQDRTGTKGSSGSSDDDTASSASDQAAAAIQGGIAGSAAVIPQQEDAPGVVAVYEFDDETVLGQRAEAPAAKSAAVAAFIEKQLSDPEARQRADARNALALENLREGYGPHQASVSAQVEPDVPVLAEIAASEVGGPAYDVLEIDAAQRNYEADPSTTNKIQLGVAIGGSLPLVGAAAPALKRVVGLGSDVIEAVARATARRSKTVTKLAPESVEALTAIGGRRAAAGGGARTFTSTDPLVGDVATQIEALAPGRVAGVNRLLRDPATGRKLTDLDIELTDVVVQVKSGEKLGGGVGQVQKSATATGKRSVLFAPNLKPGAVREAQRQGVEVFTSFDALKRGLGL